MFYILFLLRFLASLTSSDFNNATSCVCAVDPNACNPYCCCDPNCNSDQIAQFDFCLPESLGTARISCDPTGRVTQPNIGSINTVVINNVTCYIIAGEDIGDTITQLDASQFGLSNFSELTLPSANTTRYDPNIVDYQVGDYLLMNDYTESGTNNTGDIIYLPMGIGSSDCNAMLPLLYGVPYPNYTCRVPEAQGHTGGPYKDHIQRSIILSNVFSRDGYTTLFSNRGGDNIDSSFVDTSNQTLLYVQYLFQYDPENGSISYYTLRRQNTPQEAVVNGASNTNFVVFGHEVYFSESSVDTTGLQNYPFGNMAYYYGVPVMVAVYPISDTLFDDGLQRQPLTLNNEDVLFGVNASYVTYINNFFVTTGQVQDPTTCQYDGYSAEIVTQLEGMNISYCNLRTQLYPSAFDRTVNAHVRGFVFNTYGNVFSVYYAGHSFTTNHNATLTSWHVTDQVSIPTAQWTFFYKRMNTRSTPLFVLQNLTVSVGLPTVITPDATGNVLTKIDVVFIEIDDNGNHYSKQLADPYSGKLSMIFDTFFSSSRDSIRTIGIFFCFALLGTIWCWYMCFFYIE